MVGGEAQLLVPSVRLQKKKNSAALGDDVTCVSLRKQKICVALG